jgi:membrane protease YdiL (CAAX protease family)
MTTLSDLIFVAMFAVVGPLIDYAVFWPIYERLIKSDAAWARTRIWAGNIGNLWMLVAIGAAIWIAGDRSWAEFGFTIPGGWRYWTAIALILLLVAYYAYSIISIARNPDELAKIRKQVEPIAALLPRTRTDLYWFGGVSLTAGFCEEFLFRGYFIWTLAPWLGWWGSAALSLAIFAVAHLYQGWAGVLKTAIFGALFTLTFAIFDSLWPAIAFHVLVDISGGAMSWLALRESSSEVAKAQEPG